MMIEKFLDEFVRFPILRNNFSSVVKDMQPYRAIKTENGYQIVIQTLGMSKEDIEIELLDGVLTIKGDKKIEPLDFNQKFERKFSFREIDDIESIEAESKDGLTYINIKTKKKKENKVKISWK